MNQERSASPEEHSRHDSKKKVRKWSVFGSKPDIIPRSARFIDSMGRIVFKCHLGFHLASCGSSVEHAFRGESLRQSIPQTQTLSLSSLKQHRKTWDIKTTAALQGGTYAELTGGGMKKLQGGTLWRWAQQSRSASLHAAEKAPAMLLGNICCSSQLQVFQGASLQDDLTTSV